MSGFEVIGLILALYPVVVDAVIYCRGVRSGEVIHDLLEEVRAEKVIFCNWIQHLCVSQISGRDVQEILNPESEIFALWNQNNFLSKLMAARDAEASVSIIATLKGIHDELQFIHRDLENLNPKGVDFKTRLKTSLFALKSGPDSSEIKRRLKKIHKLNERLRRVIDSSPQRRYPRAQASEPIFEGASCASFATSVFRVVASHFRCSCQSDHLTKLLVPMIPNPKSPASAYHTQALQLLFSVEDETSSTRHGSAKSVSDTVGQLSLSGEMSVSSLGSQETESDNTLGDYALSSVQTTNSLASSVTLVFSPKCYCISVTECGKERSDEIADICSSIRALSQEPDPSLKPQSLGVVRASGGVSYELQYPRPIGDGDSRSIISLDDLFTGDQSRLARRYRIRLALKLAWGVTQLHQTPWISPKWTWSDFSAITNRQQGQMDEGLFITKQIPSIQNSKVSKTPDGEMAPTFLSIAVGDPILARLGYALIELASGKRLASLHESNGTKSEDNDLQDLLTARHLLDSGFVMDEECKAYSDVVHACLYQQVRQDGRLGLRKLRPQDPSFGRDLTRIIVQPLYNIYRREWEGASVELNRA